MATNSNALITTANNALLSISKGEDKKLEMVIAGSTKLDWAHVASPAPMSINILGNLMLISIDTDFSLTNAPRDGWKYVRHPESFRACLVQVSNEGYDAFSVAHKSMQEIQISAALVPSHAVEAFKIVNTGSGREIKDLLPLSLQALQRSVETCQDNAKKTEDAFARVMAMTGELTEALTASKGTREKELVQAKAREMVLKAKQSSTENLKKMAEVREKELSEAVVKYQKMFEKAMDDVPSGWSLIGMNLVNGLASSVSGMAHVLSGANIFKGKNENNSSAPQSQQSEVQQVQATTADLNAYALADIVYNAVESLQLKAAALHETKFDPTYEIDIFVGVSSTKNTTSPAHIELQAICNAATKEAQHITKLTDIATGQINKKTAEKAATSLHGTVAKAAAFSTKAKQHLHATATSTPFPTKVAHPSNIPENVVQAHIQNCQFKLEQSRTILESQEKLKADAVKESMALNEKNMELLREISEIDWAKADYEKIIQILRQGVEALGKLKAEWAKLVMFFQSISSIVKVCIGEPLRMLIDKAQVAQKWSQDSIQVDTALRFMLMSLVSEASKKAYLVETVARIYGEISSKYIMANIAGLSQLMGLDSTAPNYRFLVSKKRLELEDQCLSAQRAINSHIESEFKKLDTVVQSRLEAIDKAFASLPKVPENPAMLEGVKQGQQQYMEEAKAEKKADDNSEFC